MKKNIKSIYKFELVILLLNTLLIFIQNQNYKYWLSIVGFGIILLAAISLYKRKKDKNFFRGSAFRIMLSVIIFYFIIINMLGLLLGFNKTLFSTDPAKWLTGVIPIFIITIIVENLRYILIKSNSTDKFSVLTITLLIAMFYILISSNLFIISNLYKLFVLICVTMIPIIAQELLSTFMIQNYGFLPTISYKLIMNLYLYIIPIITDLGDYLYSVFGIIIPFTIYFVLKKYIKTNEDIRKKNKKLTGVNLRFITIPMIVLLVIIIILVSGIFKFYMIAIASNSMVPTYEMGDAIIIEKVEPKTIEEGDILVFKKDGTLIAHRVIKTKENSSSKFFYTKGDANTSSDSGYAKEEDVIGVVRRVVKYIGYPTVLINRLFGGELSSENQ